MRKRLAMLTLAGVFVCLPAKAQSTDEIIARSITERGLDKLRNVQTITLSGRLTGPGMDSTINVRLKRPNRYRMDLIVQDKTLTEAFTGSSGWRVNPFGANTDPQQMTAGDLKVVQDQAEFVSPLVDYKAKGHKVELVGKEKVKEAQCFKLKVTLRTGTIMYQYIDASFFLEIREELIRTLDGKTTEIEESVGDYKAVGEVLFPYLYDSNTKGSAEHYQLIFEKIELNSSVEESIFPMPGK